MTPVSRGLDEEFGKGYKAMLDAIRAVPNDTPNGVPAETNADVPALVRHDPLLRGNYIRILQLLPGDRGDEIRCEIEQICLDDDQHPPYEAVSYVWGARTRDTNILMQGQRVSTTDNLYDALLCLRLRQDKRTLWVDQLCIQQSDVAEKSAQVALMGRIYRECETCQIWIGNFRTVHPPLSQTQAQSALDALEHLPSSESDSEFSPARDDGDATPSGNLRRHTESGAPDVISDSGSDAAMGWKQMVAAETQPPESELESPALQAFIAACTVWSSRVWTLQEVVLPSSSVINWGGLSTEWETIDKLDASEAIRCVKDHHQYVKLMNLRTRLFAIFSLKFPRQILSKDHRFHLLQVFLQQRARYSSDPRDKIFGLLGLFPVSPFPGIPRSDYNLDTHRLFTIVTIDLISRTNDLVPIVGQGGEPRVTSKLPSWALDFVPHPDSLKRNVRYHPTHTAYLAYDACAGHALDWNHGHNHDYEPILHLWTLQVDTIAVIGQALNAHIDREGFSIYFEPEKHTRLHDHLGEWMDLARTHLHLYEDGRYSWTSETWRKAFHRTVYGDFYAQPQRSSKCRLSYSDAETMKIFFEEAEAYLESGKATGSTTGSILFYTAVKRGFFITTEGMMGLGPPTIQVGDQVRIFAGCRVPLLIRPLDVESRGNCFTFLGDGYAHGIMDGEFVGANQTHWDPIWLY